ncbi:MAG: recombinase family protein [Stenotrophomonas maltophilia]
MDGASFSWFAKLGSSPWWTIRKGEPRNNQGSAGAGNGDVLVVWRLDRLGRSLIHLVEVINGLRDAGIGFRSLQEQIDTTSAGGRFYLHILAALAEFERELISERTRAGMEAARRNGQHLGRPRKLTPQQVTMARHMIESRKETRRAVADRFDVDVATLRRALTSYERELGSGAE